MRTRCAVCRRPLPPKPPGEPGPAKTYCGGGCRQEQWRRRHPLGWRMIRELGLPDRSPLAMMRERGFGGA
jgi:hypothetical protein